MQLRDAVAADAQAACDVMRRSIIELCEADHGNDPAILAGWLRNKAPANFLAWLRPGNSVLVAVEDGTILSVGAITDDGEITLNYVSPAARFRGVSKAMLAALEQRALERGDRVVSLNSTATARRFYTSNGYREDGPPERLFGIPGTKMSKMLGPP